MKRKLLSSLFLSGSLLATVSTGAQASFLSDLFPPKNSTSAGWQYCNVDGCKAGGDTARVTTDYAKTKYPIVLGHGMGGFSAIAGVDYWYGIPKDLTANGASVFVTQQASFNSSEVRGEQLLSQVKQILAITGKEKVNLIGHSHGSQSVRYVAGLIPQSVASVTTVGGAAKGSPVADVIAQVRDAPVVGGVIGATISSGVNAFFSLVGIASGHYYDQDSLAGLDSLTAKGASAFNQKFPEGVPTTACGQGNEVGNNGVRYYSWSGKSIITNILDPNDALSTATSLLISEPSDGIVPVCSSHLGKVIRDDYAYNHFDEINQTLGMVGLLQDPVAQYRIQANRLKGLGL